MSRFTYSAAALAASFLAACGSSEVGGDTEVAEAAQPGNADTDPPAEAATAAKPRPEPVPVGQWALKPAWPLPDDKAWVPGPGRLVTTKGIVDVKQGEPCGDGIAVPSEDHPVAWLPPAEGAAPFPMAPAVPAAFVERMSWRLGEVLGPPTGLVPGGRIENDPALYQGLEVRTIRKTRRQGQPVLIGLGDRSGKVAVAITDREAGKTYSSDVVDMGAAPWPVPAQLPAQDYDGDGKSEMMVYGDVKGDGASLRPGFRAMYRVELGKAPELVPLGVERTDGKACSAEPKAP
jgi:hypothetical protein